MGVVKVEGKSVTLDDAIIRAGKGAVLTLTFDRPIAVRRIDVIPGYARRDKCTSVDRWFQMIGGILFRSQKWIGAATFDSGSRRPIADGSQRTRPCWWFREGRKACCSIRPCSMRSICASRAPRSS